MAIETTEFANVNISVSPTGASSGNFGILGFLTNEATGPLNASARSRAYTGLPSVGSDWPTSSEVYKSATAFYGQTPTPKDFVVLANFATAQKAALVGGGHDTLLELVAGVAGAGNFNMVFDPASSATQITIGDLDFSAIVATGQAGLDLVATALEDAITAANAATPICTVIHNGLQFVIETLDTGIAANLSFAEGETGVGTFDAAEALGLESGVARKSDGIAIETPVESLAAAVTAGINFIGLDVHRVFRDVSGEASGNNSEDISDWAEGAKKIFCNTTNNLSTLDAGTTTDIGSVLQNKSGVRFSLTSFSSFPKQYPSSSAFGRAASVNFSAIGSTITLNLKSMPTISAEDLSPGEFKVLRAKNVSAVVKIGSSVNAFTDSRMAGGSWLDTTHGLLWLENRIEVDMFNLLYVNNTKIPFTQVGINTSKATLERSLEAAVRNGLIAPGFLPDGTYLEKGYIVNSVPLADVPVDEKGNRLYAGHSFKAVGAGALHELAISGEFSE